MNRLRAFLAVAIIGTFLQAVAAEEPQWGDLSGQLIYDGEAPKPRVIMRMGFPPIPEESLVVDAKTHGIANIFVWLRTRLTPEQIHPNAALDVKALKTLIYDGLHFLPHALLLQTGQKLVIKNVSPNAFAWKVDLLKNGSSSLLLPANMDYERTFHHDEFLPSQMACAIHPWVSGSILIRDNPYMALTDSEGRFTIKNLPAGEHEFQFWHERSGYLELPTMKLHEAEVAGKLDRGRPLLEIKPGENNLKEIKIDPKHLQRGK